MDTPTVQLIPTSILSEVPHLLSCGHEQRIHNSRFCSVCGEPIQSSSLEREHLSLHLFSMPIKCVEREQLDLPGNEFIFHLQIVFSKNKVVDSGILLYMQRWIFRVN